MMNDRQTASAAKPLSPAKRKAALTDLSTKAPKHLRAAVKGIEVREPTAKERAFGKGLAKRASHALGKLTSKAA